MKCYLFAASLAGLMLIWLNAPAHAKMAAPLAVQGEAVQLADLPLLVTVTLTNTGDKALSYWCGGPGTYPGAEHFTAEAVRKGGKAIPLTASSMFLSPGAQIPTYDIYNGQYQMGSGVNSDIAPGAVVTVPLAVSPLPPGEYVLHFHSVWDEWGEPPNIVTQIPSGEGVLRVLVRRDETLRAAREQSLLERVRHGDPFAEAVISHYHIRLDMEPLLLDLTSDDTEAALHAAVALFAVNPLPAAASAQISAALKKHLHDVDINAAANFLTYLTYLAVKTQSPESLDAMILLVHSDRGPEVRWHAAQALGQFHQAQALTEMHTLLTDPVSAVRGAVATSLAQRHDAAALPVLIALIQKPDGYSGWNSLYGALAQFPDDPQAKAAILAGLKSTDVSTSWQAEAAQKLIQGKQNTIGIKP